MPDGGTERYPMSLSHISLPFMSTSYLTSILVSIPLRPGSSLNSLLIPVSYTYHLSPLDILEREEDIR